MVHGQRSPLKCPISLSLTSCTGQKQKPTPTKKNPPSYLTIYILCNITDSCMHLTVLLICL